jgi:hypothetical protein
MCVNRQPAKVERVHWADGVEQVVIVLPRYPLSLRTRIQGYEPEAALDRYNRATAGKFDSFLISGVVVIVFFILCEFAARVLHRKQTQTTKDRVMSV